MKRKTMVFKGDGFDTLVRVLGVNKRTGKVWVKVGGYRVQATFLVNASALVEV